MKDVYTYQFINNLFGLVKNNWVDIEREYFRELVKIQSVNINEESRTKMLINLNESINLIKKELEIYLSSDEYIGTPVIIKEIESNLHDIFVTSDSMIIENNTLVLNFNYTDTTKLYLRTLKHRKVSEVNIHGHLNDNNNPIIFGYGDESDDNYQKIEKLNQNEYLKHMKSFAYLQTSNYRNLFEFLDRKDEKFEVFILGHSCGLSDRLLFTHIFEHPNLDSVKIFYYEKPDGTNDFFQKTQEISRYFRLDLKHRMRTKVVPFNESKPLTTFTKLN